jgi:hypothetical protein
VGLDPYRNHDDYAASDYHVPDTAKIHH